MHEGTSDSATDLGRWSGAARSAPTCARINTFSRAHVRVLDAI